MLKERLDGGLHRATVINDAVVYLHDLVLEGSTESVGGISTVTLRNSTSTPGTVILEIPLGDAVGFWNASSQARNHRTLDADWVGRQVTSIVNSAPLGCVYGMAGQSLLGFAFDETVGEVAMQYGVSEETKTFVVQITFPPGPDSRDLALHATLAPLETVVANLTDWLYRTRGTVPMYVPEFATEPVYSTWYAYNQAISAAILEPDLDVAAQLGLVTVIIDDGWQRFGHGRGYQGCGDWTPDTEKFPDLREFIDGIHRRDMRAVLWVAPLLLGAECDGFEALSALAPHVKTSLNCHILDPRLPEVREHIVRLCGDLVERYGLDGLKIDFLDEAMVYAATSSTGDIEDVGLAMEALLAALRERLEHARPDGVFIEFRHPYVSPAIAPYANVLRASDCPGDAFVNRGAVIDARMLAAGRVVHSDPILWDGSAPAQIASRHLLNTFFGVPQVSMPLSDLSAEHFTMVKAFIALWTQSKHAALGGSLTFGLPADGYPIVVGRRAGGQCVVGVYAPSVVTLETGDQDEFLILNATAQDSVVVDVRPASRLTVTASDALGEEGARQDLHLHGLHRLPVPVGGVIRLVPTPDPLRT